MYRWVTGQVTSGRHVRLPVRCENICMTLFTAVRGRGPWAPECLSVSVSKCLPLRMFVSSPVSPIWVSMFLYVSLFLSLFWVYMSVCLCFSACLCLSVSLCLCVFLLLHLNVCIYMSVSVCVYLFRHLSLSVNVCFSTCLSNVCLFSYKWLLADVSLTHR